LPWDDVLSAEMVKRYKPDPRVYQMGDSALGPRTGPNHDGSGATRRISWRRGLAVAHGVRLAAAGIRASADLPMRRLPTIPLISVAEDFTDLALKLGA